MIKDAQSASEIIAGLISDVSIEAGELSLHVEDVDDYSCVLEASRDETLVAEDST